MAIQVYVLPGFMGSDLRFKSGPYQGQTVWYAPRNTLRFGVGSLQLAADGVSPGPLASGPLEPFGPVDTGLYEPLITALANAGFDPKFYEYDWRISVNLSAADFANYLLNVQEDRPFAVVCHSTGGLVAQLAYTLWKADGGGANWTRTVYCGTPHGGTYYAALAASGYRNDSYFIPLLAQSIELPVRRILNPSAPGYTLQQQFLQTLASFVSLYELMPSTETAWAALDPGASALYTLANWSAWNPAVTQQQLDRGAATRAALAAGLTAPRAPEVCCVALGQPTPSAFVDPPNLGLKKGYGSSTNGDNTVLLARGVIPGQDSFTFSGDHSSYCGTGAYLSQLPGLIRDGLPTSKALPPPFVPGVQLPPKVDYLPPPPALPSLRAIAYDP